MRAVFDKHRWWLLRVLVMPIHLLTFAVITFFLIRLMPGDPVYTVAGGDVDAKRYAVVQHQLGLDGSLWSQFLHFLNKLAHFDLGTSYVSGKSVTSDLINRFPPTLELVLIGLTTSGALALFASFFAVLNPKNPLSRFIQGWARTAGAVPEFVLAIGFITVFYVLLHWAPAPLGLTDPGLPSPVVATHFPLLDALLSGNGSVIASTIAHMVLPIVVMTVAFADLLTKHLLLQLSRALDTPVTRFRISTGASRRAVLVSVARRALPVPMTIFGAMFGGLLGGVVLLEILFNLQGLGVYAVQSANSVDLPALQGFMLLAATCSLIAFLLTDIVNMVLDPRRRPGRAVTA
jgi:ABC-type dipeptide/oligopeptide/nickel transport system permease component